MDGYDFDLLSPRSHDEVSQYSWKRPYELSPDGEPQLYVDGTSRRDVIQVLPLIPMFPYRSLFTFELSNRNFNKIW